MKPTRNRVHCPECNRAKMLFETEAQALNFIKFNAESIKEETGYAPVRAYYCEACGGWHVTSQEESSRELISKTEIMIRNKRNEELSSSIRKIGSEVEKAKVSLFEKQMEAAKAHCLLALDMYQECLSMKGMALQKRTLYKDIKECIEAWTILKEELAKSALESKLDKLEKRIAAAENLLNGDSIYLAKQCVGECESMYKQYVLIPGEEERKALLKQKMDKNRSAFNLKYGILMVRKTMDKFQQSSALNNLEYASELFNTAVEYLTSVVEIDGREDEKKALFADLESAQNRLREMSANYVMAA